MPKTKRTDASSFDMALREQIEEMIAAQGGDGSGGGVNRGNLDDVLLGQLAATTKEENDQKILEVNLTCGTLGWAYIKEVLAFIEAQYKKDFEDAESDSNNQFRLRYHAARDIIRRIINVAEETARMPLSTELPED